MEAGHEHQPLQERSISLGPSSHRVDRDGKPRCLREPLRQVVTQLLGLTVQAFVQVSLATHGAEQARSFARLVAARSEIISAWTLTGDADYLLRVYCADLPALNGLIHDVLLTHAAVSRVQSQIVMDQFKQDAPLPT